MWSDWLVFCDCDFHSVTVWWRRLRGLWKLPDGRDWLTGSCSDGQISKSLIQFSVDGWSCVPSLLFTSGQTMVEVMKIMATSFKRSHENTATLSAPNPEAGYRQPSPLPETPGHSQACLGQSLVGSLLLSLGSWCTQDSVCPPGVCFPVLCKFWQLYGGVNGDLLQEGLCHTQVCCTQSPCPWGRPLLTCTVTLKHSKAGLAQPKGDHKIRNQDLILLLFLSAHLPSLLPNSFTYNVLQQRLQGEDVGFSRL